MNLIGRIKFREKRTNKDESLHFRVIIVVWLYKLIFIKSPRYGGASRIWGNPKETHRDASGS